MVPISLTIAHLFGLQWNVKSKKDLDGLKSLTAGLSVAYVFLVLIPEIAALKVTTSIEPLTLAFFGFIIFHLTHSFVFQTRSHIKRITLLDEVHVATAGLYNFLLAFLLVELLKINIFQGIIVSAIIITHTILSELTHADMQPNTKLSEQIKPTVIILGTLAGGLLATFGVVHYAIADILFGFTAGAIIYITIREEIPSDSKGKPKWFIIGAAILYLVDLLLLKLTL